MMKDFRDRVAVVTGAASGIGLGIASSLVKRGVAVVMIDVEATTLEAAAAKLSADGAHVMPLLVDVYDRKAMYSAADQIRSVFGRDRKSVGSGKSVSVRVDVGGRRIIKKKQTTNISETEQRQSY